jgi:hypothetical protein
MLEGASRGMLAQYEQTIALKNQGVPADHTIYDLRYADLVKDPVAEMKALYRHLHWEFTAAAEQAMRAHLATHKKGKHGHYDYSFADTGLDYPVMRERFAAYQARYGIPSEV